MSARQHPWSRLRRSLPRRDQGAVERLARVGHHLTLRGLPVLATSPLGGSPKRQPTPYRRPAN